MNKYFASISKLDGQNVEMPPFENRTESIISDIQITESELVDILLTLDPKKASRPDRISHRPLKIFPQKLQNPLKLYLINPCPKVNTLLHGK